MDDSFLNSTNNVNRDLAINDASSEALLHFITKYRDLPELWADKSYANRGKKKKAYEELLTIFRRIKRNATVEDVKKKINVLRTNFRREMRRIEASKRSGTDEIYVPKCWTFKELLFLKPLTRLATPSASLDNYEDIEAEVVYDYEESENANDIFNHSTDKPLYNSSKKPKIIEPIKNQNELITMAYEYLQKSDDEEEAIAKSWAYKLRRMQGDQRIWANKFINDILTEGELGTLHRHSVQIKVHDNGHPAITRLSEHRSN